MLKPGLVRCRCTVSAPAHTIKEIPLTNSEPRYTKLVPWVQKAGCWANQLEWRECTPYTDSTSSYSHITPMDAADETQAEEATVIAPVTADA